MKPGFPFAHCCSLWPWVMALLLTDLTSALLAAEPGFTWRRTSDTVALLQGGQVVWQFNYGTNEAKPCFHPLALPGGPVLTWYRPADHRWHRALWFSWKFINGLNYWEEDAQTGLSQGRTTWRNVNLTTRDDYSARVEMDLDYRPAEGPSVMTEHRRIEVGAPQGQGEYWLDWAMTFTAGPQDVKLDRTPLPQEPEGKVYGGYAGLSVRLASGLKDVQVVSTREPVVFAQGRYRGRATAVDYSGLFGQREAGLAILDHPENLNAPSPWYVIDDKDMRFFSPAVLCFQPHTLKSLQTMTLRYRVIVHPGRWPVPHLQEQIQKYLAR